MTEEKWRYVLSAEGREIELSDGEVTLGRSRTSTVRLEHESVSRSHALLTFDRGEAVVKDLASSNGTFVGGKRIVRETRLVNGDRLQLGAAVIDVRLLAPDAASERTALMTPDQLPDAPSRAPALGHHVRAGPRPHEPGPVRARGAARAGPDLGFGSFPCRGPSARGGTFHGRRRVPADGGSARRGLHDRAAHDRAVRGAPPPRELADYSIRVHEAEKAARIPPGDRAASFRDRRTPSLNETPRGVANPFARLLAALVDAVILAAINVLLFAPVFLIDYFRSELQTHDAAPDWAFRAITGLSILLALLANVLYVVGGWAWRGRTPGKSLLGLAVVRRGSTLGPRHRLAVRVRPRDRLRPRGPPAGARVGVGVLREGEAGFPGPRGRNLGDQGPLSAARSAGERSASSTFLGPPRSRQAPSERRARARRSGSDSPSRT